MTATPGSVSTKKNNNVIYTWSGDGVTGNGATATVNTASLAPGTTTVKVEVKEGKKGKEGLKPGQTAECSSSIHRQGIRAADDQLLGEPQHDQAGGHEHDYRDAVRAPRTVR